MAKITEVMEIERQRQDPQSWNIIHLFKEGGFYRAYEWSAWLVVVIAYNDEVRKQHEDRKPLTVTRKPVRDTGDTFCFVGFPLKSGEKFIPERTSFVPVSDSQIDIGITLPQPTDGSEITYERLSEAFEKWKADIPLNVKVDKDERQQRGQNTQSVRSLTGIMTQVLAWPLEMKTPMENTQFISDLKQQLAALL